MAGDRSRSQPQFAAGTVVHAPVRDSQADAAFATGEGAGATGDKYVRDTVFLATVLFLVGISGHLLRAARYAVIGVGILLLIFSIVQLLGLPGPPS